MSSCVMSNVRFDSSHAVLIPQDILYHDVFCHVATFTSPRVRSQLLRRRDLDYYHNQDPTRLEQASTRLQLTIAHRFTSPFTIALNESNKQSLPPSGHGGPRISMMPDQAKLRSHTDPLLLPQFVCRFPVPSTWPVPD